MFATIYILFCLHVLGDYFLQTDFLAKTKGSNFWHMAVHCLLYTVPFIVYFGIDNRILLLFMTHFTIDSLKAHYNKIDYTMDQVLHMAILILLYFHY